MTKKVSLLDVKQALRDSRFREALPAGLQEDVQKYLQNPGCACNVPIYRRVLRHGREALQQYYPDRDVPTPEEEAKSLSVNNWTVINCSVGELKDQLKRLPPGRKQLALARYEDQVTVVVNELDILN